MPAQKKALYTVKRIPIYALLVVVLVGGYWLIGRGMKNSQTEIAPQITEEGQRSYLADTIVLPSVAKSGRVGVEQALNGRREEREISDKGLNLKQVSQLLWATQGVTADWGGRSVQSAKEVYPLELYIVVNEVEGLERGVYHYIPGDTKVVHQLGLVKKGEMKSQIYEAINQTPVKDAPVVMVMAGNFAKMTNAYGKQSDSYVYLEAGGAAQNTFLQAESLGLGMVVIHSFDQTKTRSVIDLPLTEKLIYVSPVGYIK